MIDWGIIAGIAVLLLAYMCAFFVIALITKDNGVADIGYGGGFVVVTAVA